MIQLALRPHCIHVNQRFPMCETSAVINWQTGCKHTLGSPLLVWSKVHIQTINVTHKHREHLLSDQTNTSKSWGEMSFFVFGIYELCRLFVLSFLTREISLDSWRLSSCVIVNTFITFHKCRPSEQSAVGWFVKTEGQRKKNNFTNISLFICMPPVLHLLSMPFVLPRCSSGVQFVCVVSCNRFNLNRISVYPMRRTVSGHYRCSVQSGGQGSFFLFNF